VRAGSGDRHARGLPAATCAERLDEVAGLQLLSLTIYSAVIVFSAALALYYLRHPSGEPARTQPDRSAQMTDDLDPFAAIPAPSDAGGCPPTGHLGEIDPYLDLLDPEVEFETASATRLQVTFHGHTELREYLEQAADESHIVLDGNLWSFGTDRP
jgi:hypothetical protein